MNVELQGNRIGKGVQEGLKVTTLTSPYLVFEEERYVALAYKYRLIKITK